MKRWILILAACVAAGPMAHDVSGQSHRDTSHAQSSPRAVKPRVTFVELGSVKCIPCKKMQPVMKAIEEKYAGQVKVVFHDVWTEEGRSSGDQYRIRLIPTQVFLDSTGTEFFRHEGFYPEAEIDKLLQQHGLKVRRGG